MRVLFLIPKNPPPQLTGSQWSRSFKEFVEMCLNKDPDDASFKILLIFYNKFKIFCFFFRDQPQKNFYDIHLYDVLKEIIFLLNC